MRNSSPTPANLNCQSSASLTNQEARRAADPSRWDAVGRFLLNDRIERFQTGKVNYIKVVSSEAEPCVLPGLEAFNAFMALKEKASCKRFTKGAR